MNFGSFALAAQGATALAFLVGAAVLLGWTGYLELSRDDRRRLAARLTLNFLAVASLLLLALRPYYERATSTTDAVLITEGADAEAIRRFVDSSEAKEERFSVDRSKDWRTVLDEIKNIPDLAYLKRNRPEISRLHVFGSGLPEHDWEQHRTIEVVHNPGKPTPGIASLTYPQRLELGERLGIQGSVVLHRGTMKIKLLAPGGAIDSLVVNGIGRQSFGLTAVPPDTGRFLYTLILESEVDGSLQQGKLGVYVTMPSKPRVLVLESSPGFETRYLKNWLAKENHSVAIRSRISRKRFRTEFLNHAKLDLAAVTSNLLARFDLVLLDGRTLARLAALELSALRAAVLEGGLGVLMLPDDALLAQSTPTTGMSFFRPASFKRFSDLEHRVVKVKLRSFSDRATTGIRTLPFEIEPAWGISPLITDVTGALLASAVRAGNGLIGTSLILDSYRWVLQNEPEFHSAYWSDIISTLGRRDSDSHQWSLERNGPHWTQEPIQMRLSTTSSQPVGEVQPEFGRVDQVRLRQDQIRLNEWQATYWAGQPGWHRALATPGTPYWFFVNGTEDWSSLRHARRTLATERFAAQIQAGQKSPQDRLPPTSVGIPPIWFFLTLLISQALHWVEKKV